MCDRYDCVAKEEKQREDGETYYKEPSGRHPIHVSSMRMSSLGRGRRESVRHLCDECYEDYKKTGKTPPFKPKPSQHLGKRLMSSFRDRERRGRGR